jgi:hypothetical protein
MSERQFQERIYELQGEVTQLREALREIERLKGAVGLGRARQIARKALGDTPDECQE